VNIYIYSDSSNELHVVY